MSRNVCKLCHGMGSRFIANSDGFQWWTCQGCGGAGTRTVGPAPPEIRLGTAQSKFLRPLPSLSTSLELETEAHGQSL